MRHSISAVLLTLATVSILAQQHAPWEWDDEARIAARIAAASGAPKSQEGPSAMGMTVNGHTFTPGFRIDGAATPELFLPTELMTRVLMGLDRDAKIRVDRRESLRDGIRAQGWQESQFWTALETAGSEYAALSAKSVEIDRQAQKATPPERRELEAKSAALQQPICAARRAALNIARERFGRLEFDRFLYTAVAPKIVRVESADSDAQSLRYVEGGCR